MIDHLNFFFFFKYFLTRFYPYQDGNFDRFNLIENSTGKQTGIPFCCRPLPPDDRTLIFTVIYPLPPDQVGF